MQGDLSLWTIFKIVGTVLGSGALLGFTVKVAQLFFDRHDRKSDKKESEIEKHITDAAALRKLDDERATDLYNRVKGQVDKCEEDCKKLEAKISTQKQRIKKYQRNRRNCLEHAKDLAHVIQKISDMISIGFKKDDVLTQVTYLLSDVERLSVFLEEDPEDSDLHNS